MAHLKLSNVKRHLQTLLTILTDDDDELLLEEENELLRKMLFDQNQSNCTYVGILSHIIGASSKPLKRTVVEHDDSFCDEEVPKLSLDTFQSLFGVSRKTVQMLTQRLAREKTSFPSKFRVPLQKRILMMLWILANQESFRSVGERFGMMAPGNVHYVFYSMCDSVCILTKHEISWPNFARQQLLATQFLEAFGVSDTIGVLGCIYIAIKCPDKNEQYYDHDGVPSICLQAVCDHKLSFLDIHAGKPGSYSPEKVFVHSPLGGRLDAMVDEGLSVIAGSEYSATSKISIVHKYGHRSDVLSLITKAFTKLRNTFQRLKYIDMQRPHATIKLIQTACTIHNFVINECDEPT